MIISYCEVVRLHTTRRFCGLKIGSFFYLWYVHDEPVIFKLLVVLIQYVILLHKLAMPNYDI
jgi:hypothetical protein